MLEPSSIFWPSLDTLLTGFPNALPTRWGSSVQSLMPLPEEAVEDAATLTQHRTLYLMDVGTPVLGLGWRRRAQVRGSPHFSRASGSEASLMKGWGQGGGAGSGQHAYLTEDDFAMAGAILCISDKHFPIVLDPALATQDVVNTGCHLVPLKVVPKPERDRHIGQQSASAGKQVGFEGCVPNLLYQVTWVRKKESQGPSAGIK